MPTTETLPKTRETLEAELAHAKDVIDGLKRKLRSRSPLDERERGELISLRAEVDHLVHANRSLQRRVTGTLADVAGTLREIARFGRETNNPYATHMARTALKRLQGIGVETGEV